MRLSDIECIDHGYVAVMDNRDNFVHMSYCEFVVFARLIYHLAIIHCSIGKLIERKNYLNKNKSYSRSYK